MIINCIICSHKVGDIEGVIRGKVLCNSCYDSVVKTQLEANHMFCPDKNYSESQIQDQSSIAKAILSSSSVQHSKQSFPSQNTETTTKLKRRTNSQKVEFSKKLKEATQVNTPPKKAPKKVTPLKCPKKVENIINFWKALGFKVSSTGTKNYNETIRKVKGAIRGTLPSLEGRKFTEKEIQTSMTHLSLAAFTPMYEPPTSKYKEILSNTHLHDFVYNRFTQKSLLIEYMQKPKLVENAEIPDDNHPEITRYFANFFVREVLGGIKPKKGLSIFDMQHFTRAAERTADFYKTHKDKMELRGIGVYNLRQFAELVTEALTESVNGDLHKLSPGWFSSDAMFGRRLPAFLYRNSIIEDRRDF